MYKSRLNVNERNLYWSPSVMESIMVVQTNKIITTVTKFLKMK